MGDEQVNWGRGGKVFFYFKGKTVIFVILFSAALLNCVLC